jgi:RecA/RadA recombinase
MSTEQIKNALLAKSQSEPVISKKDLLSTGCTLLNLALSGRSKGGVPKGKYILVVGDSDTGKSWFGMSLLAEAANNPEFEEYDLIYNNAEDGTLMDVRQFFGAKLADRIKVKSSDLLDTFYDSILTRLDKGKKFIEILDSHDVLEAKEDDVKDKANRSARKQGTKEKGTFGMAKAKMNSTRLRKVRAKLKKTGSILMIISQTRDNAQAIGPGDKKTRAGGRALKFYAIAEYWTSLRENITKLFKKKKRQIGIKIRVQVKKNHITGRKQDVNLKILHGAGIDDVGSNIDWLVEEGHWKGKKLTVSAPEFNFAGRREELVRQIEQNGEEQELRSLVTKVWKEIEAATSVKRKPRYA